MSDVLSVVSAPFISNYRTFWAEIRCPAESNKSHVIQACVIGRRRGGHSCVAASLTLSALVSVRQRVRLLTS